MFDMRAYVASLIAVFLALAIGILLGTVIQERAPLVDQIQKQVENLQGDFAVVREENKNLSDLVEADKAFMKKALPLLTEGKLASSQVVVISTDRVARQTVKATTDALERAGAEVTQMDLTRYGMDNELRRQLAGFMVPAEESGDAGATDDSLAVPDEDEEEPLPGADGRRGRADTPTTSAADNPEVGELHTLISNAIFDEEALPTLSDLARLEVVKLNTPAAESPSAVVMLVEPGKDDQVTDSFLVPLAREAAKARVNVVAAESGALLRSLMGGFDAAGITTVDNVDETVGEISLVYTVAGEKGSFGKKKGAEDISPPLD